MGATKRVAPGLGPTGRAGGPLVHPLFLSPIIIPWPPDVMRTQTSLNGSFSAAQSAEKADRFCDECYRSITFSQERKLAKPSLRPSKVYPVMPRPAVTRGSRTSRAGRTSTTGAPSPPESADEVLSLSVPQLKIQITTASGVNISRRAQDGAPDDARLAARHSATTGAEHLERRRAAGPGEYPGPTVPGSPVR